MTKTKIILSTTVIGAAVVSYVVHGFNNALIERFPTIDPKIVRKVHREIVMESLAGKYNNIETTDEVFDKIFIEKVAKLRIK
jgi:Fe-S-cluster formation regulator IscX/YfhJ